eukprot:2556183-Alexandrium_andersonii.AAC.1
MIAGIPSIGKLRHPKRSKRSRRLPKSDSDDSYDPKDEPDYIADERYDCIAMCEDMNPLTTERMMPVPGPSSPSSAASSDAEAAAGSASRRRKHRRPGLSKELIAQLNAI